MFNDFAASEVFVSLDLLLQILDIVRLANLNTAHYIGCISMHPIQSSLN